MSSYTKNLLCSPLPKDFTVVQLNEITLENKLPCERMIPGFSMMLHLLSHSIYVHILNYSVLQN